MHRLPPKISAAVLLLIAAASLACMVVFTAMQGVNYFEMMAKLKAEKLTIIYLTPQQLEAQPDKDELVLGHRMFDVHSIQQMPSGKYAVSGLYDDEEKALCNELSNVLDKNGGHHSQKAVQLLFSFLAVMPVIPALPAVAFAKDGSALYSKYCVSISLLNHPVLIPPPKA